MRKAVTVRSWWKICCPQSKLSLERSGEISSIIPTHFTYFSAALYATYKVIRRFVPLYFSSSLVHVIEYSVRRH